MNVDSGSRPRTLLAEDAEGWNWKRSGEHAKKEAVIFELASSKTFQRLSGIRFLGGIDFCLVKVPNGAPTNRRYTRSIHSLGVADLAYLYSAERKLDTGMRKLACVAALLHDIGHSPLSHSIEGVFKRELEIDHHIASAEIITGKSKFGTEVLDILRKHSLDADQVIAVIEGKEDAFEGFFSGPINFDTIDGILRSWSYCSNNHLHSPINVMQAASKRESEANKEIVDDFWNIKNQVYQRIIRSALGVAVDKLCEEVFLASIHQFTRADFFSTENQFFTKLPTLKQSLSQSRLEHDSANNQANEISYVSRKFVVNDSGDFFARDDKTRYHQFKENW